VANARDDYQLRCVIDPEDDAEIAHTQPPEAGFSS
jgi:hypothetical protein